MALHGRYSIVRYVEDIERGEALNVGVLLEVEGTVLGSFTERESLRDPGVVRRFAETLGVIQSEGREATLDELVARRFGHFRLSSPRAVVIDDDPQRTLERLVDRLVRVSEHALSA